VFGDAPSDCLTDEFRSRGGLFCHAEHLWLVLDAFLIQEDVPDVSVYLFVGSLDDTVFFC